MALLGSIFPTTATTVYPDTRGAVVTVKGLPDLLDSRAAARIDIEKIMAGTMETVQQLAWLEWQNLVKANTKTSREKYLESMRTYFIDPTTFVISIANNDEKGQANPLPYFVEFGMSAHSMQRDLLFGGKGPKVSKDGTLYKVIPFNWATSASGTGARKQIPPQEILDKIKELEKLGGGVLQKISGHHTTNIVSGYRSKFDIFKGLTVQRTNKSSKMPRYSANTFRTVSEKSEKGSWFHLGIIPRMFHVQVTEKINGEFKDLALGAEITKFIDKRAKSGT